MKTKLPERISTIDEAKVFLTELYNNGESFHPEDDANDIAWEIGDEIPTHKEAEKLNELMEDIYNLPGNDGRHCGAMVFDPCEFILKLDPDYGKED